MKFKRKLVVYKTSWLDFYKNDVCFERIKKNKSIMKELNEEKAELEKTIELVKEVFYDAKFINRKELKNERFDFDLIIPVGGDGTFLEVSHYIKDETPVFFINSDSRKNGSEGFFAVADRNNLLEMVEKLYSGELKTIKLNRLKVEIDDKPLEELVLNDILVAHSIPAGMTRYIIKLDKKWVEHKNSGLYISTAAGSTGASRSCGGKILPICSKKFQFVCVAPYKKRKQKMLKGIVKEGTILEIESRMTKGKIYIDGQFVSYDFSIGKRLKVYNSEMPLFLIGFDKRKRRKY